MMRMKIWERAEEWDYDIEDDEYWHDEGDENGEFEDDEDEDMGEG